MRERTHKLCGSQRVMQLVLWAVAANHAFLVCTASPSPALGCSPSELFRELLDLSGLCPNDVGILPWESNAPPTNTRGLCQQPETRKRTPLQTHSGSTSCFSSSIFNSNAVRIIASSSRSTLGVAAWQCKLTPTMRRDHEAAHTRTASKESS